MPTNSPYDVVSRRQATMTDPTDAPDTEESGAEDPSPPPSTSAFRAPVVDDQQALAQRGVALGQQQVAQLAATAKAQAAQDAKTAVAQTRTDHANATTAARVAGDNFKTNGQVTQMQAVPGPGGKDIATAVPQKNEDGTDAYTPKESLQQDPNGNPFIVRRNNQGAEQWEDPYTRANANLSLNSAGALVAKPKGKAASLPEKDVSDTQVPTPEVMAQLDQREQKLVTAAAAQHVKDAVGIPAAQAAQDFSDARQDHQDALEDLRTARANPLDQDGLAKATTAEQVARDKMVTMAKANNAMRAQNTEATKDPLAYVQKNAIQPEPVAPGQQPPPAMAQTGEQDAAKVENDAEVDAGTQKKNSQPVDTDEAPDLTDQFNTPLTADEEKAFQVWKEKYAPKDDGSDYDLRGAFKAGVTPASNGHWPDTFKKPNEPTFSNQSQYATGDNAKYAGSWDGDKFIPPAQRFGGKGAPDGQDFSQMDLGQLANVDTSKFSNEDRAKFGIAMAMASNNATNTAVDIASQQPDQPKPGDTPLQPTPDTSNALTTDANGNVTAPDKPQDPVDASLTLSGGTLAPSNTLNIPMGTGVKGTLFNAGLQAMSGIAEGAGQIIQGTAHAERLVQPSTYTPAIVKAIASPFLDPDQQKSFDQGVDKVAGMVPDVTGAAEGIGKGLKEKGAAFGKGDLALPIAQITANKNYAEDPLGSFFHGLGNMIPAVSTGGAGIVLGGVQMGQIFKDDAAEKGLSPARQEASFVVGSLIGAGMQKILGPVSILHDATGTATLKATILSQGIIPSIKNLTAFAAKNAAKGGLEGVGQTVTGQVLGSKDLNDLKENTLSSKALGEDVSAVQDFAVYSVLMGSAFKGLSHADVNKKVDADLGTLNTARDTALQKRIADIDGDLDLTTDEQEQQKADARAQLSPIARPDYVKALVKRQEFNDTQDVANATQTAFKNIEANPKMTSEQKSTAKQAVLAKVPAGVRGAVQLHLDGGASANAQITKIAAQADTQAKQIPKADPNLAHLSDDDLASEHAEVTAALENNTSRDNLGGPDATPEYQAALEAEASRRQQVAILQDQHDSAVQAVQGRLAASLRLSHDMAKTDEGRKMLDAVNAHNATLPEGAPKADAVTASVAGQLADDPAFAPHYIPVAHDIDQLPNADQQVMAQAAIKVSNGRALNSQEQTLMFGDPATQTPPAVDAITRKPFVTGDPKSPVLTEEGRARLNTLVPSAAEVLNKTEGEQKEAVNNAPAKPKAGAKPAEPEESDSFVAPANPDNGHRTMTDEALQVRKTSLASAMEKAKAEGRPILKGAQSEIGRIQGEINRRQHENAPAQEGEEIQFHHHDEESGHQVRTGAVEKVDAPHGVYHVIDTHTGHPITVPFHKALVPDSGKEPESGGNSTETKAEKGTNPQSEPEETNPKEEASPIPGIDPKELVNAPVATRVLAKAHAVMADVFRRLGMDPKAMFKIHRERKGLGLAINPDDLGHVLFDPEHLETNLAALTKDQIGEDGMVARVVAALQEEGIHLAGEQVAEGIAARRGITKEQVFNEIHASLTEEQLAQAARAYGDDFYGMTPGYQAREYIRMKVQLELDGRHTEAADGLTGPLRSFFQEVIAHLKQVFGTSSPEVNEMVGAIKRMLQEEPVDEDVPRGTTEKQEELPPSKREEADDSKNSTQINLPDPIASTIRKFGETIPENELYHEEGEQYGHEAEPHVTVHYVLESTPEAVQKLVKDFGNIKLRLGKTSIFEGEKYDVLKIGVEGGDIHRLNSLLKKEYPVESKFPDYQPHLTIAYMKKGTAEKYADDDRFKGTSIPVSEFVFSDKERTHTPISLEGEATKQRTDTAPVTPNTAKPTMTTLLENRVKGWTPDPTLANVDDKALQAQVDKLKAKLAKTESPKPEDQKKLAHLSDELWYRDQARRLEAHRADSAEPGPLTPEESAAIVKDSYEAKPAGGENADEPNNGTVSEEAGDRAPHGARREESRSVEQTVPGGEGSGEPTGAEIPVESRGADANGRGEVQSTETGDEPAGSEPGAGEPVTGTNAGDRRGAPGPARKLSAPLTTTVHRLAAERAVDGIEADKTFPRKAATFVSQDGSFAHITKTKSGKFQVSYHDSGKREPWTTSTHNTLESAVKYATGRNYFYHGKADEALIKNLLAHPDDAKSILSDPNKITEDQLHVLLANFTDKGKPALAAAVEHELTGREYDREETKIRQEAKEDAHENQGGGMAEAVADEGGLAKPGTTKAPKSLDESQYKRLYQAWRNLMKKPDKNWYERRVAKLKLFRDNPRQNSGDVLDPRMEKRGYESSNHAIEALINELEFGQPHYPSEHIDQSRSDSIMASAITKTPEFKRWFGDSKVVDEAGKPLIVYHGGNRDFTRFLSKRNWFTSDPSIASEYAMHGVGYSPENGGANIKPIFVSIQKPFVVDGSTHEGMMKWVNAHSDSDLKAQGYDGVIFKDAPGGGHGKLSGYPLDQIHQTQIKSAIGNNGEFSSADSSIIRAGNVARRSANDPRTDGEVGMTPQELRDEYNADVARVKSSQWDAETKGKRLKGMAMQFAAKMRFATGQLTGKEAAEKQKFEASNYLGKPVSFNGQEATVVGPVFGKVRLRFGNGSTALVLPDEIEDAGKAIHAGSVFAQHPSPEVDPGPATDLDQFREMADRGKIIKAKDAKPYPPDVQKTGYAMGKHSGYSEADIAHWYRKGIQPDSNAFLRYSSHANDYQQLHGEEGSIHSAGIRKDIPSKTETGRLKGILSKSDKVLYPNEHIANDLAKYPSTADVSRSMRASTVRGGQEEEEGVVSGYELQADSEPQSQSEEGARNGSPEAAASLLRREIGPDKEKLGNSLSRGEQSRAYLKIAQETGKILPENFLDGFKPLTAQGEHEVFTKGDRVYKITHDHEDFDNGTGLEQDYLATPYQYINRFALANRVFGDDIQWEGVIPKDGHLRTVTSQPFYNGIHPDQPTIDKKLSGMGFEYHEIPSRFTGYEPTKIWYRKEDNVLLGDTKPANFIGTPDGSIRPIDVIAETATPEQKAKYGLDTVRSSRVKDTGTDDMFAPPKPKEAFAPASTDPAPEPEMDKSAAKRVYDKLNEVRQSGKTLTAEQGKLLERAERALGQTFMPGLDQSSPEKPDRIAQAEKRAADIENEKSYKRSLQNQAESYLRNIEYLKQNVGADGEKRNEDERLANQQRKLVDIRKAQIEADRGIFPWNKNEPAQFPSYTLQELKERMGDHEDGSNYLESKQAQDMRTEIARRESPDYEGPKVTPQVEPAKAPSNRWDALHTKLAKQNAFGDKGVVTAPKDIFEEAKPGQQSMFAGPVQHWSEREAIPEKMLGFPVRRAIGSLPPDVHAVAELMRDSRDDLAKILMPQLRTAEAAHTARIVRANLSEIHRNRDQSDIALRTARAFFDSKPLEYIHEVIRHIENNTRHPDPQVNAFVTTMRGINNKYRDLVRSMPNTHFKNFIEHYFPHIWAKGDVAKATKFYQRKIEGSTAFIKHRSIPTIEEGLKYGLHLASDNPVDLFMLRWNQMDKYVAGQRILQDMKDAGLAMKFESDGQAPEGWTRVDDRIGLSTEDVPVTKEVSTPYLDHDDDEIPGLTGPGRFTFKKENKTVMERKTMRYYAPDSAAQILKNHLSPGLRDYAAYKVISGVGNTMNQAQLGLSAFHAGFTTLDAAVSRMAVGIEHLAAHNFAEGAKTLVSVPVSPMTNLLMGSKLLKEWDRPGSQGAEIGQLVRHIQEAGGRVREPEEFSNQMMKSFLRQWRQGNKFAAAYRAPLAVVEKLARPIMQHLVPRQKLGVFADLARLEMSKLGPNATQDDVRRVMQKAWDSVDNRLGQLVYDNLFWNKAAKDLAMVATRSVGWNLGSFRELGGGLADWAGSSKALLTNDRKHIEFTHRMAYTMALPLLVGGIGGLINYLYTGEYPKDSRDYFFPRTGEKDGTGHNIRVALPSYMKDVYGFNHQPVQTLVNKTHPLFGTLANMYQNRDFWGQQIYNPDDHIYDDKGIHPDQALQKGMDLLGFGLKSFAPFAATGAMRMHSQGASLGKTLLPMIGVTPAPAYIDKSPAEIKAEDLYRDKLPSAARSNAEMEKANQRGLLMNKMRALDPMAGTTPEDRKDRSDKMGALLRQAISDKTVQPNQVNHLIKEMRMSPIERHFTGLGYEDAVKVWELATPDQKQELLPMFRQKMQNALKDGKDIDPKLLNVSK